MIRMSFDTSPSDTDVPMPTWQPDLFLPMCAQSLAEQGDLFPGFQDAPASKPSEPEELPLFEPFEGKDATYDDCNPIP
jgi:hypothetical protein